MLVRLPVSLDARLRDVARDQRLSLSETAGRLIAQGLQLDDPGRSGHGTPARGELPQVRR
ncbi:hypothetical protein [Vallicoccus soli]|uniref:hypothetical protein n=1 Tax=Vallicoccus soli TaxID=2339232 RepID=UPI0014026D27|nr:hypothetical protein [Vallicoccus soli]